MVVAVVIYRCQSGLQNFLQALKNACIDCRTEFTKKNELTTWRLYVTRPDVLDSCNDGEWETDCSRVGLYLLLRTGTVDRRGTV